MIKSMTGFGRAQRETGGMSISVELDEAVLHIYQMRLLKSSGISTVLFKTTDCETVLILDDYIVAHPPVNAHG